MEEKERRQRPEIAERIGELLRRQGADAYGWTKAEPVDTAEWALFERWLNAGYAAGMDYMRNYPDIRRDPRLLLEGAKTVISVAYNYRQPNPIEGLATYALGEDYHKVLRRRLKGVVAAMKEEYGGEWRICIDSAPILERYWAVRAGVGYRSEIHGNVVVPGVGSMVFLAELLTTLEIPERDDPAGVGVDKCDDSERTSGRRVCPNGALLGGGIVDARRCINYLTIEKREELTPEERRLTGKAVFGCDICQRASMENRGEARDVLPEFKPMEGLEAYLKGEASDFELGKSPLKRGKVSQKKKK